jgi:hypothetical protein
MSEAARRRRPTLNRSRSWVRQPEPSRRSNPRKRTVSSRSPGSSRPPRQRPRECHPDDDGALRRSSPDRPLRTDCTGLPSRRLALGLANPGARRGPAIQLGSTACDGRNGVLISYYGGGVPAHPAVNVLTDSAGRRKPHRPGGLHAPQPDGRPPTPFDSVMRGSRATRRHREPLEVEASAPGPWRSEVAVVLLACSNCSFRA